MKMQVMTLGEAQMFPLDFVWSSIKSILRSKCFDGMWLDRELFLTAEVVERALVEYCSDGSPPDSKIEQIFGTLKALVEALESSSPVLDIKIRECVRALDELSHITLYNMRN